MERTLLINKLRSAVDSFQGMIRVAERLESERAGLFTVLEELVDLYGMHSNATLTKARALLVSIKSIKP